jgi:hypothetical protein
MSYLDSLILDCLKDYAAVDLLKGGLKNLSKLKVDRTRGKVDRNRLGGILLRGES